MLKNFLSFKSKLLPFELEDKLIDFENITINIIPKISMNWIPIFKISKIIVRGSFLLGKYRFSLNKLKYRS